MQKKPSIRVNLHPARYEALVEFAEENGLSLSSLVQAIIEPVAQSIAWERAYGDRSEPDLFPRRLVELYAEPEDLYQTDSLLRLEDTFEALRVQQKRAHKAGFPAAFLIGVEDAPDGPAGPPGAPADPEGQPPHTNRGVTLTNPVLPFPLPKRKKVRQD